MCLKEARNCYKWHRTFYKHTKILSIMRDILCTVVNAHELHGACCFIIRVCCMRFTIKIYLFECIFSSELSNNHSIVTRESTMHQRASSVADIVQNVFVLNGDYFCSKSNLINHLKECTINEGCVWCELIARHSYSLSLNRAFIVTISLQMLRLHFKIHSISNAWTLCISCL